ncbi:MAG: hypothetical protein IH859_00780 [Chloroflexi bacterium]|nr:hypothetical protein [Chloroflexota bacterium]
MADNRSSKHSHEWMALTIWVGLFIGALASSIYMLNNMNLPSQILFQIAGSFGQPNPLSGQLGATALAKGMLYVDLLLFIATIYFMVSAWLKLSSLLLEVVIHYASESHSESIFATMLYIPQMSDEDTGFNPDEAEGSIPGDIVRNLAFAWVSAFLSFGVAIAIPYLI